MDLEELRFSEKKVKLSNQDIVKLAYTTKEIIEPICSQSFSSKGEKLSPDQVNCYRECFYIIRNLLKKADKEYLDKHSELCDFYRKSRKLTDENGRLHWYEDIQYKDDV
ncbi:MAG: hypothetical protein JW976_00600 [Syntrophaceae bacterium]|nr:hypothetical protein [Syntrophaceae bacterium]